MRRLLVILAVALAGAAIVQYTRRKGADPIAGSAADPTSAVTPVATESDLAPTDDDALRQEPDLVGADASAPGA